MRVSIIRLLRSDGPMTSATMAERLGRRMNTVGSCMSKMRAYGEIEGEYRPTGRRVRVFRLKEVARG